MYDTTHFAYTFWGLLDLATKVERGVGNVLIRKRDVNQHINTNVICSIS